MSEAAANSKEKNEIEVSKTILPENKKYESESLNYQINIPDWLLKGCLLYTSPSPRDRQKSRMPSSA